jgi:outer membrane protein TolC
MTAARNARLASIHAAVAPGASLLLAACAVGPTYHRPPLSPTAAYGQLALSPPHPAAGGPRLVSGQDIPAEWWRAYRCAALDVLVAQALADNPTIESAKAALHAAREQVRAQKGAFFPQVAGTFQPGHQEFAPGLSPETASG